MPEKIPVTTIKEIEKLYQEGVADLDDLQEFIDAYYGIGGSWKGWIYPNKDVDTNPNPNPKAQALLAHGDHNQSSHGNWATGQLEADQSPTSIVEGQMPRKEVGQAVRETFKVIDSVHTVPDNLPKIPIKTNRKLRSMAAYSYRENSSGEEIPVNIEINPDISTHLELSFTHEFGHYLDSQVFGRGKSTKSMQVLEEAINNSDAMRSLNAIKENKNNTMKVRGRASYYATRTESFARAYAQYIAMKSNNSEMISQVNGILSYDRTVNNVYPHSQWGKSDFQPIFKAMDNLFKNKGLLRK